MPLTKLPLRLAPRALALAALLAFCLAAPALAADDVHPGHDDAPGPMPIAALGSVVGAPLWLASTPFCLLFAPTHILDSFDLMVVAPMRLAFGIEEP